MRLGLAFVASWLLLGAGMARAETPDAFAQRLVARLRTAEIPNSWMDPSLMALEAADTRASSHQDGIGDDDLDYSMLTQSQDTGGEYDLRGVVRRPDGRVEVRLRAFHAQNYSVILGQVGGQWRIWDVVDTQMGSQRSYYQRHTNCLRTTHSEAAQHACMQRR